MTLPSCFVVTGFGIKTDYGTGRALDLDLTFRKLVQPACDRAGINAFRAIDANVTGSIDEIMYHWIYAAEFVIADLSTLNANVFYELGVRHAQRPNTTVIIAEEMLMSRIPFDLSSFVIHAYAHGGTDIAADEITRFVGHLSETLIRIQDIDARRQADAPATDRQSDSPVFTFLKSMVPPDYTPAAHVAAPDYVPPEDRATADDAPCTTLADHIAAAEAAKDKKDFDRAMALLTRAIAFQTGNEDWPDDTSKTPVRPDTFLVQRLVLATYKAGEAKDADGRIDTDRALAALTRAERLLERHCAPDVSTDPETLGLAGAINKRLFDLTDELVYLDRAIGFYERGFYIKQDYYNGINAAFMHTIRATRIEDVIEATVSFGHANMLRRRIVTICEAALRDLGGAGLDHQTEWIYATLAEAHFALGNDGEWQRLERLLRAEASDFAQAAYFGQKDKLAAALAGFNRAERVAEVLDLVRRQEDGQDAGGPQPRAPGTGTVPAGPPETAAPGRITVVPEIEPGRTVRSVEITYRVDYE